MENKNMQIEFTKMHGLGNDFVVINNLDDSIALNAEQIRFMSNRHTGIGFDQLVIIHNSNDSAADVMYKIFNADGNEAEQSGNGVRCLGKYLVDKKIVKGDEFCVENIKGIIKLTVNQDNILVNMGRPIFDPAQIPINATEQHMTYQINLDGSKITFYSLSMGNPHAVILVDDVLNVDVPDIGPRVQKSGFFPEGVNVGFLQVVDRNNVKLRVYERGAGETLACGSGACAATVAGIIGGKLENRVNCVFIGGSLEICWEGSNSDVWMTGPATTVFEGQISI